MWLLGSRDWSKVARSAFRGACMITCVIAAWRSMIWESSWSKTLRTRSGRFGSVSAELDPSRRSRPPGSWLSLLIRLPSRRPTPNSPPTMRSPSSSRFGTASRTAALPSSNPTYERYPEGTFASLARTRIDAAAPSSAGRAAPTPEEVAAEALDLAFWNSVKDSNRREEFRAYLEQHPNGHFAGLARPADEGAAASS